jgi:hypothetical protein
MTGSLVLLVEFQLLGGGFLIYTPYCLFVYVFIFALAWGPTPWVLAGEMLSETGISIATFTNWFCAIIVVQTLPLFPEEHNEIPFILYILCLLAGLMYIYATLPETKGKTKAAIRQLFISRRHLPEPTLDSES